MQDDLLEAYKKVQPTSWTNKDACSKVVKMTAPRYYISPKQAHQVISKMMKGDFDYVDIMRGNKKRMYYSLYHKCVELSEKRAFIGKSLWYIVHFAVTCEAPEFFLSPSTVARIRIWIRKGFIDDDGKSKQSPRNAVLEERRKKKKQALLEYRRMRREAKSCGM